MPTTTALHRKAYGFILMASIALATAFTISCGGKSPNIEETKVLTPEETAEKYFKATCVFDFKTVKQFITKDSIATFEKKIEAYDEAMTQSIKQLKDEIKEVIEEAAEDLNEKDVKILEELEGMTMKLNGMRGDSAMIMRLEIMMKLMMKLAELLGPEAQAFVKEVGFQQIHNIIRAIPKAEPAEISEDKKTAHVKVNFFDQDGNKLVIFGQSDVFLELIKEDGLWKVKTVIQKN